DAAERDETQQTPHHNVAGYGPVHVQLHRALRNRYRHQAVVSAGKRSIKWACAQCDDFTIDANLPCSIVAQVKDKVARVRRNSGEEPMFGSMPAFLFPGVSCVAMAVRR